RTVAANESRRVRLAYAGGQHDRLRQLVSRQIPAIESAVLTIDNNRFRGRIDGGSVNAPLTYRSRKLGKFGIGRYSEYREHFLHNERAGKNRIMFRGIRIENRNAILAIASGSGIVVVLRRQ